MGMPQKPSAVCAAVGAAAPIIVPNSSNHQGSSSAVIREISLCAKDFQTRVPAMAATTPGTWGCPPWVANQRSGIEVTPRSARPASIASAIGSGSAPIARARNSGGAGYAARSVSVSSTDSPLPVKRSMKPWIALREAAARPGPAMASAAAMTVLGVLPAARAASTAARVTVPARLTWAPTATSTSARSRSLARRPSRARTRLSSIGCWAAWRIDMPRRLDTWVSGSIWETPDASFIDCRGRTAPICRLSSAICSS